MKIENFINCPGLGNLGVGMSGQKDTIISFFKEVMSDFNKRLDRVAADVQDLKSSQTFQGDEFKDKYDNFDKNICDIKKDLGNVINIQGKIYRDSEGLKGKCIDLEDRSRRNNIRISGINENDKEKWDESKEKVLNVLENKLNGVRLKRRSPHWGTPIGVVLEKIQTKFAKNTKDETSFFLYPNDPRPPKG